MIIEEDIGEILGIRRKKIYSNKNFLIRSNGLLMEYDVRRYDDRIDDIIETNIPIIPQTEES